MGGWEVEGQVWVRSELPGRVAGGVHPDIVASQGSIPIITGNLLCSAAAQVGERVEGWEVEGQLGGLGVECRGDHMIHRCTPEGHITAYQGSIPHVGGYLCRTPGMGAGGKEGLGVGGKHPLILGR